MSSEIWKIGVKTNAEDMFNNVKENGVGGCWFARGEVAAVKYLGNLCNAMSEAYDEIIEDQNEYLIDLENDVSKLEDLQEDINAKIKQLYKEIKELEKKEQKGTITEEEQLELESKKGELKTLMEDSDNQILEKGNEAKTKSEEQTGKYKSKEAAAKDYGTTTVQKGQPLADTELKTKSFWRSIFGGTGREKKAAGEFAVKAGTELLDKVNESTVIDKEIEKNYKKFNVK